MDDVKKVDWSYLLKWAIIILCPLLILCVPVNEMFTWPVKMFFVITLLAILLFALETIQQTAVAILLPIAYVVFQIAPSTVAFSPWTGNIPWMMIGGLILANVLQNIGLLKRIAYKCIILTGCSYKGIIYGIGLAGLILNVMIPAQATIPLAALAFGICQAMGLKKSKAAAGIMLSAGLAALLPNYLFLNPNLLIVYGVGETVTGPSGVTWAGFLYHNAPVILFYAAMFWITTKLFKPETAVNGKEWFMAEYKQLGAMKKEEKKGVLICFLLFIGLITQPLHKIEVAWVFAFMPMLAYMPGFQIGAADDIKNANFPFIMFVTACMSIGATAGSLGIGQMIADIALPMLEGRSVTFVLVFMWLLCMLVNFILTPLAIGATFAVPLTQIALSLGINPEVMWLTICHGYDQILLPYEYPLYMLFFSFNLVYLKDFIKLFGVKIVVNLIFFVCILLPYWNLIGFMHV